MRPTFSLRVKGELQVSATLFGRSLFFRTNEMHGRHIIKEVISFMQGSNVYKWRSQMRPYIRPMKFN